MQSGKENEYGVQLSSFNSVQNPSTWDVSPTFKVTLLLSSLEILFQTWPKLRPLSDSKPSQADNEEHSFSTEGRLEVEMLQLPCSLRPVSALGPVLQWGICQTPGACFQTCFTQVLLPSSKRRRELLEVVGPMLSFFQPVWVLADSTWPAVSGVKGTAEYRAPPVQWQLVSEDSILPCAPLPSLGPDTHRPVTNCYLLYKTREKSFPRAVSGP